MAITFQPLIEFDTQSVKDFETIGPVHFYVEEHKLGLCALFAVMDGEKRVGSVLFCSESKPSGEKILAVVAASSQTRRSLIREGKELIGQYARSTGHNTVKFYTDRERLAYEFVKMGARAKITWSV